MKKIILLLLLSTSLFPYFENGQLSLFAKVQAQSYSLEEIIIYSWNKSESNIHIDITDNGYAIVTYDATWTDPEDPSNSYSYPVIEITGEITPTFQEPIFDGNAYFGTNFIGPGPDQNPFDLNLVPVDELDRAAMLHDWAYWQQGAGGVWDALTNEDVRHADYQLLQDAITVYEKWLNGEDDIVTGLPVTDDTAANAVYVISTFGPIVEYKYGIEN